MENSRVEKGRGGGVYWKNEYVLKYRISSAKSALIKRKSSKMTMFSAIFLSFFLLLLLVLDQPADATHDVVITDDGNGHALYNGHTRYDARKWANNPGQGMPPVGERLFCRK